MLVHIARDIAMHGPSIYYSTFGAEMMFHTIRLATGCFNQQATRLINKRFALLAVDILHKRLIKGRYANGLKVFDNIHEADLEDDSVRQIVQAIAEHHRSFTLAYYRKAFYNGFWLNTTYDRTTPPNRLFSCHFVSKSSQWYQSRVIVEVQTTTNKYRYAWCDKFERIPYERDDGLPLPWSIGPLPSDTPVATILQHYCFGRKHPVRRLVRINQLYSPAYCRVETEGNGRNYRFIAIPVKCIT